MGCIVSQWVCRLSNFDPMATFSCWLFTHVPCTQFRNKFIGSKVNFPLEMFCIQFMWQKRQHFPCDSNNYIFYRFLRAVSYRQLVVWYEILRAVQGISHNRVVVTIKYDQHSRTMISELTRSLKKTARLFILVCISLVCSFAQLV